MVYYTSHHGPWAVYVAYSGSGVFPFWMVSVPSVVLNVDTGTEICCQIKERKELNRN